MEDGGSAGRRGAPGAGRLGVRRPDRRGRVRRGCRVRRARAAGRLQGRRPRSRRARRRHGGKAGQHHHPQRRHARPGLDRRPDRWRRRRRHRPNGRHCRAAGGQCRCVAAAGTAGGVAIDGGRADVRVVACTTAGQAVAALGRWSRSVAPDAVDLAFELVDVDRVAAAVVDRMDVPAVVDQVLDRLDLDHTVASVLARLRPRRDVTTALAPSTLTGSSATRWPGWTSPRWSSRSSPRSTSPRW